MNFLSFTDKVIIVGFIVGYLVIGILPLVAIGAKAIERLLK